MIPSCFPVFVDDPDFPDPDAFVHPRAIVTPRAAVECDNNLLPNADCRMLTADHRFDVSLPRRGALRFPLGGNFFVRQLHELVDPPRPLVAAAARAHGNRPLGDLAIARTSM